MTRYLRVSEDRSSSSVVMLVLSSSVTCNGRRSLKFKGSMITLGAGGEIGTTSICLLGCIGVMLLPKGSGDPAVRQTVSEILAL